VTEKANSATERLPPLGKGEYTDAQRAVAEAFDEGPRGPLRGPFAAMLRSPEFMDRAQRLGEFLRFDSSIPAALREFSILICARKWQQTYEWAVHAPLAEAAGLASHIVDDLAHQRPLRSIDPAEQALYRFCTELLDHRAVSDATYNDTAHLLGETGVVELCGICGYYSMLAMVMNVARTTVPTDREVPFSLPSVPDAE